MRLWYIDDFPRDFTQRSLYGIKACIRRHLSSDKLKRNHGSPSKAGTFWLMLQSLPSPLHFQTIRGPQQFSWPTTALGYPVCQVLYLMLGIRGAKAGRTAIIKDFTVLTCKQSALHKVHFNRKQWFLYSLHSRWGLIFTTFSLSLLELSFKDRTTKSTLPSNP